MPDIPGVTDLVEIGRGGFAVVYRGRQPDYDRDVAVKVLNQRLDDNAMARFQRECRALGRLSGHPNIVPLYVADVTDTGTAYMVMGFVEGGSLDDRVERRGPLPAAAMLPIGVKLCGALASAHKAGILHRDIKPANVLLSSFDEPLLADFGIARVADAADLTASGVITGTLTSTAPEVLAGGRPNEAADVYSLGATLWEALAGEPPIKPRKDEHLASFLRRVLDEPLPPMPGAGTELQAVMARATAKDPSDRPASARALGEELQQVEQRLGLPSTRLPIAGIGDETITMAAAPPAMPLAQPAPEPLPVPPAPAGGVTARRAAPPPPSRPAGRRRTPVGVILIGLLVIAGLGAGIAWMLAGGDDGLTPRERETGQDAGTTDEDAVPCTDAEFEFLACITNVRTEGGRLQVYFDVFGFEPDLGDDTGTLPPGSHHLHFFLYPPIEQTTAGEPSEDGNWVVWDGRQPFDGYMTDDPDVERATLICVVVADEQHQALLDTGNCLPKPPV
jgi:tRNA A-37 threonylcarbamoyl transferase component Bud32